LELKPQGRLSVTVVKATSLRNKEMIGKSDPYVKLYVRPMFKVKTKVIDDDLNPEWNETFDLIVEDKETQSVIFEVILYIYFCLVPLLETSLASRKKYLHKKGIVHHGA
jgi:Ca2+-dependent lipid-binding protein